MARVALVALLAVPTRAHAQEPPAVPYPTPDDPIERQRDRFREGMDRYRAGAFGEAVLVWSKIYRELGPEKGYRLAFNLARAYEQVNDPTRAAEHYDVYLGEVRKRREAAEPIEPLVAKQEEEASQRIEELRAKLGRIRFRGDEVFVVIDADEPRVGRNVAYVTAGKHAITFRPSTAEQRRVEVSVEAGQIADVETPAIDAAPALPPVIVAPPPIRWETREERPYTKALLFIGAGATAVSFVLPAVLYARANSLQDSYDAVNGADEDAARALKGDHNGARSNAYASWAVPALLGTATIALAAYWYFGTKTVRAPMTAGLTF